MTAYDRKTFVYDHVGNATCILSNRYIYIYQIIINSNKTLQRPPLYQHPTDVSKRSKLKTFVKHLCSAGPASSTLVQLCTNVIQMFSVYWAHQSRSRLVFGEILRFTSSISYVCFLQVTVLVVFTLSTDSRSVITMCLYFSSVSIAKNTKR